MKNADNLNLAALEREIRIYDLYSIWNDAVSDHWFPSDDRPSSIGATGDLYRSIVVIRDQLGQRLNRKKKVKLIMDLLGNEWHVLRQKSDINAVHVIELLGESLMDWAINDSQFG